MPDSSIPFVAAIRTSPRARLLLQAILLSGPLFLVSCGDREAASSNSKTTDTNFVLGPATASSPPPQSNNPPLDSIPAQPAIGTDDSMLQDAVSLDSQKRYASALEKLNSVIQADAKNASAYILRGHVYSEMKLWDQAQKDYETVLQFDDKNLLAKFNLSEIKFKQKAYNEARPGFIALEKDPDLGDLATYKVFLCDLFAGNEEAAQNELNALNKVGSNPSFYFGNAAWYLYHKKPEDARTWLNSGFQIYAPKKAALYTYTLNDLGYLPLASP